MANSDRNSRSRDFRKIARKNKYPLINAIENKNLVEVKNALLKGADINETSTTGTTSLIKSIVRGRNNITEFLIAQGADIHPTDNKGNNALFYAVLYNNPTIVKKLLQKNADPEFKNNLGQTALAKALTSKADFEIVEALIQAGSNIDTKCNAGKIPLILSLYNKQPKSALLLIEKGANVNETQNDGVTALMVAVSDEGYLDVAKLLISKGAKIDSVSENGNTALIEAVIKENLPALKLLLENNAAISTKNKDGRDALFFASKRYRRNITELLNNELAKRKDLALKELSKPGIKRNLKVRKPFKFK